MLKLLIGNAVFGGLLWGWYAYVDGDHALTVAGAVFAFVAFLSGGVMGYLVNESPVKQKKLPIPGKKSVARPVVADNAVFDQIQE